LNFASCSRVVSWWICTTGHQTQRKCQHRGGGSDHGVGGGGERQGVALQCGPILLDSIVQRQGVGAAVMTRH
jgi:hypothetical protein